MAPGAAPWSTYRRPKVGKARVGRMPDENWDDVVYYPVDTVVAYLKDTPNLRAMQESSELNLPLVCFGCRVTCKGSVEASRSKGERR